MTSFQSSPIGSTREIFAFLLFSLPLFLLSIQIGQRDFNTTLLNQAIPFRGFISEDVLTPLSSTTLLPFPRPTFINSPSASKVASPRWNSFRSRSTACISPSPVASSSVSRGLVSERIEIETNGKARSRMGDYQWQTDGDRRGTREAECTTTRIFVIC